MDTGLHDALLLSGLRTGDTPVSDTPHGVMERLTIVSDRELTIEPKKYYKFPFGMGTADDGTALFSTLKDHLVIALSSAYANYRKFGEEFKVVHCDEVFTFSETVWCTAGAAQVLKVNEVAHRTEGSRVVVEGDAVVVYDMLMNSEGELPFVLSRFEFEGGMMFRTRTEQGPQVRRSGAVEYVYTVVGPLDSADFAELTK